MNSTKDKLEHETPHFGNTLLGAVPSVVYNEDCVEGLKRFSDNYFDLAIVDPPYGINMGFDGWDKQAKKKKTEQRKKNWDNEIPKNEYWEQLFRVSKNQIVWGGTYFIEHLKNNSCFIIWDKQTGTNNMADAELAWTSFNTTVRIYRGHVFTGIGCTNYKTIHPTQKPERLYSWVLNKYANEGDLILDTHLGSGSSRIAAYKGGFNFVGFEIDKDYYEAQEKRFKDFVSQLRMF